MAEITKVHEIEENHNEFYRLDNILKNKCQFYVIFGERSNGKTYACLEHIISKYVKTGKQGIIFRRWVEDITKVNGDQMFSGHVSNKIIEKLTGGRWTDVYYNSRRWYLCRYNEDDFSIEKDDTPFCYIQALAQVEHNKSVSYPNVTTILFDEFIPISGQYLTDEWSIFQNSVSTIIRRRDDVEVFLCGNTNARYNNTYFKNMGLKHALHMKPGTIDLYEYDSKTKVAVEYTMPYINGKNSDNYFAFDNPNNMIINGEWSLQIYPKRTKEMGRIAKSDIALIYFIQFEDVILQCEVIINDRYRYTYVHKKNTPFKDPDNDIIFSQNYDPRPNWRRKITRVQDNLCRKLFRFYQNDEIFYQDNETGDAFESYITWCNNER